MLVSLGGGGGPEAKPEPMIRVLVFVIGVIAAALSLAWLADRPGAITIEWLGYEIKTSAFVGTLALPPLVVTLFPAWALLRYLFTRPAAIAAYRQERRRRQGFDALTRAGFSPSASATGRRRNATPAWRAAIFPRAAHRVAQGASRAAQGDRASARRAFEAMLDRPETELWACAWTVPRGQARQRQ